MASKLSLDSLLRLSRVYSSVAAENLKVESVASSMMKKVTDLSNIARGEGIQLGVKKEVFWMKDPKTGNWLPESHFGEVDVVDLREKFCSKKLKPNCEVSR